MVLVLARIVAAGELVRSRDAQRHDGLVRSPSVFWAYCVQQLRMTGADAGDGLACVGGHCWFGDASRFEPRLSSGAGDGCCG